MRSVVILARHGNTFEKGDKVVMVGAHEDLPLTAHGEEQGRDVGRVLRASALQLDHILSGPLQRTRIFAERVKEESGASCAIVLETRLVEFDYGRWSGLSNDEIVALSGEAALLAWQERGERPSGIDFTPSAEQARSDAQTLLLALASTPGTNIVVTSNGRLREFGALLSPSIDIYAAPYKVKTGHSCLLVYENERWTVIGWDLSIEQLQAALVTVV